MGDVLNRHTAYDCVYTKDGGKHSTITRLGADKRSEDEEHAGKACYLQGLTGGRRKGLVTPNTDGSHELHRKSPVDRCHACDISNSVRV